MLPALALLVSLQNPGPPPAVEEEPPRFYGDQGTSHFGLALGLGSSSRGFAWGAGVNYGYFIVDRIAPGIDADVSGGTGLLTSGLLLGTVRLVPLRTPAMSLFLIGRGGRVFLASHPDGWGVGGGAGLIFFTGRHVGFQIAYDVLRLMPASFCVDLDRCTRHGFGVGLVFGL
jgi:hypothetical protein